MKEDTCLVSVVGLILTAFVVTTLGGCYMVEVTNREALKVGAKVSRQPCTPRIVFGEGK
jgi:hypothetical protein